MAGSQIARWEDWQNELAFERTPGTPRETQARDSVKWYANYVKTMKGASEEERRAINAQHGFGGSEPAPAHRGGGGGGGRRAAPEVSIPPAPGINYPGFQKIDPEKMYKQFNQQGIEKLEQLIADPKLRRIHATLMAGTIPPPPEWQQLMATGFADLKNLGSPTGRPQSPYPDALNQLIGSTVRLPNVNQSLNQPVGQNVAQANPNPQSLGSLGQALLGGQPGPTTTA